MLNRYYGRKLLGVKVHENECSRERNFSEAEVTAVELPLPEAKRHGNEKSISL